MAKAVFQALVSENGLPHRFEIDSSGFARECEGRAYHPLTLNLCAEEGLPLAGRSRVTTPADLERFDYILAMDDDNLSDLRRLDESGQHSHKLRLLREFSASGQECVLGVPDPVDGGPEVFEHVYELIDDACRGLLDHFLQSQEFQN
jgi:protein-tyrosine phosphatase